MIEIEIEIEVGYLLFICLLDWSHRPLNSQAETEAHFEHYS